MKVKALASAKPFSAVTEFFSFHLRNRRSAEVLVLNQGCSSEAGEGIVPLTAPNSSGSVVWQVDREVRQMHQRPKKENNLDKT